jgi:membrane protein
MSRLVPTGRFTEHDTFESEEEEGRSLLRFVLAIKREIFSDHILMVASGLAFHAMLAVLPTLAAIAAVWQMVADPAVLDRALKAAEGLVPPAAADLASEFVTSVPEGFGLGLGLLLNIVFVLWTAQRSASGLISALNIVFDETEKRGRIRRILAGLGIAIGGVGFLLVSLAALAVLPVLAPRFESAGIESLSYLRWPLLGLAFFGGVGLLFSFGPSRRTAKWRPFTWGTFAATGLWLLISFGLNLYVTYAGSFGQLYGSISSVIVALLWFYLSALAVLTGAEIDVTLQQQKGDRPRNRLRQELRKHERRTR